MERAIKSLSISNHFIPDVEWKEIPRLAVLTGVNGAGKTQVLEAIRSLLMNPSPKRNYKVSSDLSIRPEEFGYVPWKQDLGNLGGSKYADFENEFEKFRNLCEFGRLKNNGGTDWDNYLKAKALLGREIKSQPKSFYDTFDFRHCFRRIWIAQADDTKNGHIARIFIQYQMNYEKQIVSNHNPETGKSIGKKEIEENLGEPPWVTINKLFEEYDFKYRINHPESGTSNYQVAFEKVDDKEINVAFNALSSGEQMIVTLILWSFNEDSGFLRRLLILDEPDAHLHPQMAKMFSEIIEGTLNKKFGIQVIMSTHSPTTLCWFPDECIFLMDPAKGLQKSNRKEALAKLTGGLLYVQPAFKVVLVEDVDDEVFHDSIYRKLAYEGFIPKDPTLVFRSVVTEEVNGGGKTVVVSACRQWSNFSKETDLDDLLFGLVDNDNEESNSLPINVFDLPRYCHENFYADPLLVFVVLCEESSDDSIKSIADANGYTLGDTLKVKRNESFGAQKIVEDIVSEMIKNGCLTIEQSSERVIINYVNGISAAFPKCFLENSGKDEVLKWFRATFSGGASKLNGTLFRKYLAKTLLIPEDLVNLYRDLISR